MKEECLGNRWKEKVENYGMMHIFMLYPKGKYDAKDTSFQNLMNVLFKNEHSVEEKLEILRKQFGIKVTETMEEEVEEMSHICTVSYTHLKSYGRHKISSCEQCSIRIS